MTLLHLQAIILILLAAIGYSLATIGLKLGSASIGLLAMACIVAGFGIAALAEIEVLRRLNIGLVYISIIGVETIIVLTYAWMIGEALSLRQLGGAALVVMGLALVSH